MLTLSQQEAESDDANRLLFEIISAYICEKEGPDKKYVTYKLVVRHASGRQDVTPATIDRRYTDFYNLYMSLKRDFPDLMSSVVFPKKVIMGNFDNNLISARSTGFESFLKFISHEPRLHGARALLNFLQDEEITKVKQLISSNEYSYAIPLLLGCSMLIPGSPHADKWADLALHRFEGVSDSDLLELYLPLLHACIKVWWQIGRDKEQLEKRFLDLRRQGLKSDDSLSLLEAIDIVEKKIYDN
ncbi:hypothetical protein Trydic_g10891 [Trypoxylus dichotomus]